MTERDWFVSVGPFDEDQAVEWVEELRSVRDPAVHIDLIDDRQWYASAMDEESVRSTVAVLKAGLASTDVPEGVRTSVEGLVDDMESWLETEPDPPR